MRLIRFVNPGAKAVVWVIAFIIFAAVGAVGAWLLLRDSNPLPADIQSKIEFSPFLLAKNDTKFSAYSYKLTPVENNVTVLNYIVKTQAGQVTISQYAQPEQFNDIPEYKDRFLSNVMKQYASVQTSSGTVYLGRAAKQQNKQLAVMIERGLLVFMSPSKELSNPQWRALGDRLEILKPTN